MELEALIRALAPSVVAGARPAEVVDLAYDTRAVSTGALFFCVRGSRVDGHDLAWEAVEQGAVALVVERELDVSVPQLVVPDSRAAMVLSSTRSIGPPEVLVIVATVFAWNDRFAKPSLSPTR